METDTENNSEEKTDTLSTVPKKIALQVPSLFIKSSSSSLPVSRQSDQSDPTDEKNEKKKISRPMPGSMKKKLEQGEDCKSTEPLAEPEPDIHHDPPNSEESADKNSAPQKKPGRPMPASMRKKLEESKPRDVLSQATNNEEGHNKEAPEIHDSSDNVNHQNHALSPKRVSKPMPASARKRLNESNAGDKSTNGDDTHNDADGDTGERSVREDHQKPKISKPKPMPASVRKKLGETDFSETKAESDGEGTDTSKKSTSQDSKNISKTKKRPMPASAKKKLETSDLREEDHGKEFDDEKEKHVDQDDSVSDVSQTAKAMPGSAKKKLETTGDHNDGDPDLNAKTDSDNTKTVSHLSKKSNRPMPASARRKLEKTDHLDTSEAREDESTESRSNGEPDLAREDVSMNVNEESSSESTERTDSGETLEAKKINISLGGIKFPTFKKPMPESVRKKLESKSKLKLLNDDAVVDSSDSHEQGEDKVASESESTRRGRSSKSISTKELQSLTDEKYRCQYCDYEAYSLYAKDKHEQGHFKDPSETTKKDTVPKVKTSKKVVKKESKYKDFCPYCDKRISNRKKLAKHAPTCRRRQNLKCKTCGKQFKKDADLRLHNEQLHSGNQDESLNISQEHDDDEPRVDRSPSPSPSNSSFRSKSATSDKSDDKSSTEHQSETPSNDTNDKRSKNMNSFKRKIADVLSNLGSRLHKRMKHESDEDTRKDEEDDDAPSQKEPITSKNRKQKNESIRGLAMPESVRKKLEDRGKEGQTTAASLGKSSKELDDNECEVCHRIFTLLANRQRHERNTHSIKHPRPSSSSASRQQQKEPKQKSKFKENTTAAPKKSKASLTLEDIPKRGKCPICHKFISTKLRRHCRNVHKIPFSAANAVAYTSSGAVTATATPVVRSKALKSYKIYKSAADKAKKKLTSNPVPVSPTKQPEASPKPTVKKVPVKEIKPKKSEEIKPKTEQKKITTLPASAVPIEFSCACCDEIFKVKIDFNEHMTKRHPKQKRLVTCKLCMHMFSHEDDFILHIQFKHKELVSGMEKQNESPPKKLQKLPDTTVRALHSSTGESKASTNHHTSNQVVSTALTTMSAVSASRKSLRGASSTNVQNSNDAAASESCQKLTIDISQADKVAADDVLNSPENKTTQQSINRRSRRQRSPSPVPDPEPMDTYYDDGPASPVGLDESSSMDIEESGIAITATFSQRTSARKAASTPATIDDRNKMPCSVCNEIFNSFEALRKHELYFHNMKTSKMCPICGVFPTRLSRHLLAHENKSVKCSCAPCDLNFADFASLLKHNLKTHPETSGGAGVAPAANKNITKESSHNLSAKQTEESFRCKLCNKTISGGSHARRHVRRAHPECEDDPEEYLDKVEDEDDMDIGNILEDTNKKLLQSDWDDNDDYTPASPIPASSKPSSEHGSTKKPKRPLPASIRAKLEAKKDTSESIISATSQNKPNSFDPKPVKKPLPASIRAKLEAKRRSSSSELVTSVTANIPSSSGPKSVKRPLPASIKAKLEQKKAEVGQKNHDVTAPGKSPPVTLPKPGKPMPASMRAKLNPNSQNGPASIFSDTASNPSKISASQDKPKPRPMPASMRAKLASQSQKGPASIISDTASNSSKASSSRDKPKPKRPMPASARARLLNKAELKEVTPTTYSPAPSPDPIVDNDDSNHSFIRPRKNDSVERGRSASARSQVVTLDDDDDDVAVVAVIKDSVPIVTDALGFNIADEIANHNRTVQVVVVNPTNSDRSSKNVACTYKCKLCQGIFDSGDDIRGHIQRDHDEYGAEHTENLIETIYKETVSDVSRRRRSNVNYNKSYRHDEDEAEEEVIVSRGTSTRPRGDSPRSQLQHAEPSSSPAISHSVEKLEPTLLMYACKFCGKRMDMPGNVKRHISKAHPGMKGLCEDDVILLEPGREHEFVPQFKQVISPQKITSPVAAVVATPPVPPIQIQAQRPVEMPPPVGFKCKICQKTMDVRKSLVQHIYRSHPEVKSGGDIASFVQDVYENNLLNSAITEMETSVETYTCGFCSFQTTDEHDYVRHYKKHTGVSPYHCQYCSATFNRQQQLTGHITREHTGAEFLNDDEAEISMEEMVGVGEISVSTASRIQIDHPKVISLNPRFGSENEDENIPPPETDSLETPEVNSAPEPEVEADSENAGVDDGDNGVEMETSNDNDLVEEQPEETESFPLPYQGDLSSLFPTLGGSEAPGGLADMDGEMDLD